MMVVTEAASGQQEGEERLLGKLAQRESQNQAKPLKGSPFTPLAAVAIFLQGGFHLTD